MSATLSLDGMTVPVHTSGASRRARLTIERDGSLSLRAAADVNVRELEAFLASKREWIFTKLAEKEVLQEGNVTKEIADGEGFLYLGRNHQLRIVDTADRRVRMERGRLVLPSSLRAAGSGQLIVWYQQRGMDWLPPRVSRWAARVDVDPGALEVAELGHKWGVASANGRVRIHWAAMQLRPELVDYVLAHELTHLREAHHGPAFWRLLARVMPDFDERKATLATTGARLWFGHVQEGQR